jgi:DNA repair protein RadC
MSNARSPVSHPPSPFDSPRIRLVSTKLSVREPRCSYAVNSPDEAAHLLQRLVGHADREHFVGLCLDAKHKVTHAHVVSIGTTTSTLAHPREVFKAAILANATAVIIGHNHPSGDVTPSPEDHELTARLRQAGEVIGIPVLDALVVGPGRRFFAMSAGMRELP